MSEHERAGRRDPGSAPRDLAATPYRGDRDRLVASPFFARLGGVTQVVTAGGSGQLHNRLTHSLKVAQIGRAVAERLRADPAAAALMDELGGCDPDVVEAASVAHDLGHPPFGHQGEQVLDRLARERFGLPDGFEGNAQSFRIVTTTDARGPRAAGLDLTAAVRAAVLKYPWTRSTHPSPHPMTLPEPPRGAGEQVPGTGSPKFSAYITELADLLDCRAPFPKIAPWQQTVESSVMDNADDIAYAIHDLEDFHRIGVLQHAPVSAELGQWETGRADFAALSTAELAADRRRPGGSLETLRRRLSARDAWMYDDDAFGAAVTRVRADLVDALLAVPFDGSVAAELAFGSFSSGWTRRLVEGVHVVAGPPTRSGHVLLARDQWHEVQVLKFVHRRFVLLRPDLGLHQRGQAGVLVSLVDALDEWLRDPYEADRLPRRLLDLVELAQSEYTGLAADHPETLPAERPPMADLARGRAVIDFVASLTDGQTVSLLDALSGRESRFWSDSLVL